MKVSEKEVSLRTWLIIKQTSKLSLSLSWLCQHVYVRNCKAGECFLFQIVMQDNLTGLLRLRIAMVQSAQNLRYWHKGHKKKGDQGWPWTTWDFPRDSLRHFQDGNYHTLSIRRHQTWFPNCDIESLKSALKVDPTLGHLLLYCNPTYILTYKYMGAVRRTNFQVTKNNFYASNRSWVSKGVLRGATPSIKNMTLPAWKMTPQKWLFEVSPAPSYSAPLNWFFMTPLQNFNVPLYVAPKTLPTFAHMYKLRIFYVVSSSSTYILLE